jgi:hypothetical protein
MPMQKFKHTEPDMIPSERLTIKFQFFDSLYKMQDLFILAPTEYGFGWGSIVGVMGAIDNLLFLLTCTTDERKIENYDKMIILRQKIINKVDDCMMGNSLKDKFEVFRLLHDYKMLLSPNIKLTGLVPPREVAYVQGGGKTEDMENDFPSFPEAKKEIFKSKKVEEDDGFTLD